MADAVGSCPAASDGAAAPTLGEFEAATGAARSSSEWLGAKVAPDTAEFEATVGNGDSASRVLTGNADGVALATRSASEWVVSITATANPGSGSAEGRPADSTAGRLS